MEKQTTVSTHQLPQASLCSTGRSAYRNRNKTQKHHRQQTFYHIHPTQKEVFLGQRVMEQGLLYRYYAETYSAGTPGLN